jgi:hypothetical protein
MILDAKCLLARERLDRILKLQEGEKPTVKQTWRNLRDESRKTVWEQIDIGYRACDDQIKVGALCRIADAAEKMAGNWITLVRDRDNFQRANNEYVAKIKRLERKIKRLGG